MRNVTNSAAVSEAGDVAKLVGAHVKGIAR